jgi:hypothetical protein
MKRSLYDSLSPDDRWNIFQNKEKLDLEGKTLIICKICGSSSIPEQMQLIYEHHCFICVHCVNKVIKPFLPIKPKENKK